MFSKYKQNLTAWIFPFVQNTQVFNFSLVCFKYKSKVITINKWAAYRMVDFQELAFCCKNNYCFALLT